MIALIPPLNYLGIRDDVLSSSTVGKTMRRCQENKFPIKLFEVLERSDICGYSSIISWVSNGRLFKIHDEELFISQVMKKYFIQSKFTSFKRQLYFYGFRKVGTRFLNSGSCHNELFSKGQLSMCGKIRRCRKSRFNVNNKIRFLNQTIELDHSATCANSSNSNINSILLY